MPKITLEEILNEREYIYNTHSKLLSQYQNTLVSFNLNIPGTLKNSKIISENFFYGCELIEKELEKNSIKIIHSHVHLSNAGNTAFYIADENPIKIKKLLILLEEIKPIGRLFDIDIIEKNGNKISRSDIGYSKRKCFICDKEAFICSRNQYHPKEVISSKVEEILITNYIKIAVKKALLTELQLSPKPGLVDKIDSGSHSDMDYNTFISSIEAIVPHFSIIIDTAFHWKDALNNLFPKIREIGIEAEKAMFLATNNVNTHKGAIFLLGILCAISSYSFRYKKSFIIEDILFMTKEMTYQGLTEDFIQIKNKKSHTNGEKIYLKYGYKGIREEVLSGFSIIKECILPLLQKRLEENFNSHQILSEILITLFSKVNDTNVINRSNIETLLFAQEEASYLIKSKKLLNEDYISILEKMNENFIKKNISHGGCADLLSVTLFLWFLEISDENSNYSLSKFSLN